MAEREDGLRRLRALTAAYLAEAEEVERSAPLLAGVFGTKGAPADDPCHARYEKDLGALLEELLADGSDPQTLRAALEIVYATPPSPCPRSAYWMLIAVQTLTEHAIPRLDPKDAAALATAYRSDYPRWQRLPSQERIFRALKQRANS